MKANKGFFAATAGFLKKNIYYVLLFICVAAIVTMIIVAVTYNGKKVIPPADNPIVEKPEDPKDPLPIETKPMVFALPVREGSVGLDFSFTEFVLLGTQERYQLHRAIDFVAPAGTNVYAVYDGTVESVKTDIMWGTVVVIKHQDGVTTIYQSLSDDVKVKAGDSVKTNDIIGYVSDSMFYEVAEGPHLHFEVWQNGAIINPYTYLLGTEK